MLDGRKPKILIFDEFHNELRGRSRDVEVVLAQLDVRAVGDRGTATAPMPWQLEPDILPDHVHHRGFQLVGGDVLRVDPAERLRGGELGCVARGLIRAQVQP